VTEPRETVAAPLEAPTHGRLSSNGLLVPIILIGSLLAWQLDVVASSLPVVIYVLFAALIVFCFETYRRDHPVSYLSIVGPAIAVALVGLLRYPDPRPVAVASVWLILWQTPAGRLVWPWWQRNVLRRMRAGTPEREMLDAARRVWAIATPPLTQEAWNAAWAEIGNASIWVRPHTVALHSVMQSWVHVLADGTQEAAERVVARWREEAHGVLAWVHQPKERDRIDRERRERPTRGTCLEYEYPRLEALLATATDEEQRRIRAGSARIALRTTGLLGPDLESLLTAAEGGQVPAVRLDSVDERIEAFDAEPDPDDLADRRRRQRERHALVSLRSAVRPLDWPLDASDAVYEAARSFEAPRVVDALESLMIDIVGAQRAAAAHEIPAIPQVPDADQRTSELAAGYVDRMRPAASEIAWLLGTSFVAGSLGFVVGETGEGWLAGVNLYPVLFSATVTIVLVAGAAVAMRSISDRDVTAATIAAVVSLFGAPRLAAGMYPWILRLTDVEASYTLAAILTGVATTAAVVATYGVMRALARLGRDGRPPRRSESPSTDRVAA
jgi:hypothetical protein